MQGFICVKNGMGYKPTKRYLVELGKSEGVKILPDRAMEKLTVRVIRRGNENKIIWVCRWGERPPIGWILNLSPIYMCPFCDAPVAEKEKVVLLTCGFCGGAFSKDDAT